MTLLPRTLAGRVLSIMIAGLVLAAATSFALFLAERERAIQRFAANDLAARILEYARTPAGSATAPARGGPRLRLRWQEVASAGATPEGSAAAPAIFTAEVRRILAESLGADPVVWIVTREFRRPEGPPTPGEPRRDGARPGGLERGAFDRGAFDRNVSLVTVALTLPGGRNAQVESPLFLPALQVPSDAWVSLVLLVVVAAAFCVWAVRLAVQPVRMLAEAAERLSRNIDEPPLAETGAVEIRAATRAFNRMQDRLRRHVNSRALAFAAMSHDIRTPLTRLRLRLETLGEDARASLEEDLAEIASIAESALEVTRGLAPEEAIASVDLHPFVKRLLDGYLSLGDAIELKGASQTVAARPAALRRVLVNLIDNALKYGKDVTVEIADAQGYVDIRVCDRGPGIPEEHLSKVVYPFYRVESSRNRGTGGTGLGLAIAKDIVEGHGGELLIGNQRSGGLCVTVRLPR